MSPLLGDLINIGDISDKCLRCDQQLENGDCLVACQLLITLPYQQIDGHKGHDYQANLWKLAEYSFCRSCATKFPEKVKSYYLELADCPLDDLDPAKEAGAGHDTISGSTHGSSPSCTPSHTPSSTTDFEAGSAGSEKSRRESRKRKERRTCGPTELKELAQQIKQMERDTNGFKKRISVLKQELQTERNQRELLQHRHKQLQRQHDQMVDIAATKYAEMIADRTARIAKLELREAELIADGTARIADLEHRNAYLIADGTSRIAALDKRNADLIVEGTARIAELMQKITELESRNTYLQQQLQDQHTIDHTDIAMMVGTIKELNAGLTQCYGEHYKMQLTATSRHVVETLEPM